MRTIGALLLLSISTLANAGQAVVKELRYWTATDHVRLVLEASAPITHQIFSLANPDRVVLDLKNAQFSASLSNPEPGNPFLKSMRSGIRQGVDVRLVLDMKGPVRIESQAIPSGGSQPYQLVIKLFGKGQPPSGPVEPPAPTTSTSDVAQAPGLQPQPQPRPIEVTKTIKGKPARDIVVAVDAGHGGEDPGAKGARGSQEKYVTLDIARQLAEAINREPGMRAVLVRDGDYFIPLRKRMDIARSHHADLFVSIHADAFNDSSVRGSSVFTLSGKGASSEAAKWLADKENSADLVGGVSLGDKDDVLASVLLDLSQSATLQASGLVANKVYSQLQRIGPVHGSRVQQAGFAVLKSPDIPSLLVETAFISNPDEERKLNDPRHQQRIAATISQGIKGYFYDSPPMGTKLAEMKRRGNVPMPQFDAVAPLEEQPPADPIQVVEATESAKRANNLFNLPGWDG